MCGLIGAFNIGENEKPVNEDVINILEDQFNRGKDGYGIVFINDDGTFKVERATEPVKALLDLRMFPSRMIILHHRQPTSSPNKISQTHPIMVESKELKYHYLVIHNGVISNHKDLKEQHEKDGYFYGTEMTDGKYNDSESLAIEVAKFIENKNKEVGALGSAAFIALQVDKKTKKVVNIHFARKSVSSLNLGANRRSIRISSEGPGDEVKENMLYSFAFKDFKRSKRKIAFAEYKSMAQSSSRVLTSGGYYNDYGEFERYNGTTPRYNTSRGDWEDMPTSRQSSLPLQRIGQTKVENPFDEPITSRDNLDTANAEDIFHEELDDTIQEHVDEMVTDIQQIIDGAILEMDEEDFVACCNPLIRSMFKELKRISADYYAKELINK